MRMKKHSITEQEYNEIKALSKANKNKRVEKRLQVILLRYEGKKDTEIAEKLGYTRKHISKLCADFKNQGATAYGKHKYGGNSQAVDTEKEKEILDRFREKAEAGQVVTAADIKRAFDEYRGKDTGRGYIYMLLDRHEWRMVMPRGKHPQKASEETIAVSKKLKKNSTS